MKNPLLHHFIKRRTLEADLNAPDRGLAIPDRVAMLIFDILPEILKPDLLRRLIFDLMGLVIDQGGKRSLASAKGQTRDAAPALTNQIRTIDQTINRNSGGSL